jgi:hypothetical protein
MMKCLQELATASNNVRLNHLDRLYSLGVSRTALFDIEYGLAGHFGVSQIEINGDLYAPGGVGNLSMILPTNREGNDIDDLVAFYPSEPEKFWLRLGAARFLNHNAVDRAVACGEPLFIHETPFDWLRAGWQACVILDWDSDLRGVLPDKVLVWDHAFADRLQAKMGQHTPEVRVIEDYKNAA